MKKIYNIVKLLLSSKLFVIYTENKKGEIEKHVSAKVNNDLYEHIAKNSRIDLINNVGEKQYGENLERYDIDLFNAYKECDYQIAKNNYIEAEFDYYKTVNDPMSGDANVLFIKNQRVMQLKKIYDNFK